MSLETRTRHPVVVTHERGGINDQPRHRTAWERDRYASFEPADDGLDVFRGMFWGLTLTLWGVAAVLTLYLAVTRVVLPVVRSLGWLS